MNKTKTKRLLSVLRGSVISAVTLIIVTVISAKVALPQTDSELKELRDEIRKLHEEQEMLREELDAVKAFITKRRPAPVEPVSLTFNIDGSPSMGDGKAKIAIVEFSDYKCPFCARHARQTLSRIENEYVKTGKVKYVFRDFPIEAIHPQAAKAHEAARCAGDQHKYWQMHDRLFANQKTRNDQDLSLHAEALGLAQDEFGRCLETGKHAINVREDIAEGRKAGVRGTPTFFLGLVGTDDTQIKAVRKISGAQPYDVFKDALDGLFSLQR